MARADTMGQSILKVNHRKYLLSILQGKVSFFPFLKRNKKGAIRKDFYGKKNSNIMFDFQEDILVLYILTQ